MAECKHLSCSEEARSYGEEGVSRYGAKFCSTRCELRYDHIKADAQDAKMAEHREAQEGVGDEV